MVTKLPAINEDKVVEDDVSLDEYINKHSLMFHDIFEQAPNDIEKIVQFFESKGFSYLASKQIDFYCPCSKERMIENLKNMYRSEEHTSELQSRPHLVCRLLLEKKKKT